MFKWAKMTISASECLIADLDVLHKVSQINKLFYTQISLMEETTGQLISLCFFHLKDNFSQEKMSLSYL